MFLCVWQSKNQKVQDKQVGVKLSSWYSAIGIQIYNYELK